MGKLRMQAMINHETFQNDNLVKHCLYVFAGSTMLGVVPLLISYVSIFVTDTPAVGVFPYGMENIEEIMDLLDEKVQRIGNIGEITHFLPHKRIRSAEFKS